jgi:hypothetical protein
MKNLKKHYEFTGVIILAMLLWASSGCEESAKRKDPGPVFYPPAPDMPRIQFLKYYSGPEDVGKDGPQSGLDAFLFGDETSEDSTPIGKPFGIDIYDHKLYVCDLDAKNIRILDLKDGSFTFLTRDRRLINPSNIAVDDGIKYVCDTGAKVVFVFDQSNNMSAIWLKGMKILPVDIVIKGQKCYVLDANSCRVIVLDKTTGKVIKRIGKHGKKLGQIRFATCLAVDDEENVYISDKISGFITKLNSDGIFQQKIGQLGDSLAHFLRVKGLDVDREGRIWVVDSGSGMLKIFDPQGRLLMIFGYSFGKDISFPGMSYLPGIIRVDYDHVEFFQQFAVEGAELEYVILVTNQFGRYKVNVYGFGTFPSSVSPDTSEAPAELPEEAAE